MSAVVWVVQEGNNNYSPAEMFGEVRFVTKGDMRQMRNCQQNEEVSTDLRRFKAEYIPGVDLIIPSGNPMVVANLTMNLPVGDHKFLKWDGRISAYLPFTLTKEK